MHPCLTVSNVLSIIFTEVDDNTLVHLAATCKSFSEPALDLLWESQVGLRPLLQSMAPDLWDEVECGRYFLLENHRPIIPADWSRFNFYARRVQYLTVSNEITPDGFHCLLLSAPTLCLFPNLRRLAMDYPHDNALPCVHILLGPRLAEFEIISSMESGMLPSFLRILHSKCPNIKTLKIHYDDFPPIVVETCASWFTWDDLRCVTTNELTAQALIHLSAMPALRELRFKWDPKSGGDICSALPWPRRPAFPALRVLAFETWTTTSICNDIINLIQDSPLEFLRISFSQSQPPVETSVLWRSFFYRLANLRSRASLATIVIVSEWWGLREAVVSLQDHVFRSDTLKPLYSFHNLEHFHCETAFGLDLDDTDVEEMARAWPSLRTLELVAEPKPAILSRVTFTGLSSLIRSCPDLRKLGIEFDTRAIDHSLVATAADTATNLAIKTMNGGHSPIEDPAAVAQVLSVILPNVRRIDSYTTGSQWSTVESCLKQTTSPQVNASDNR